MSGEQQTREKMVPMSAIEQACRDVFLDKTTSTVANELHGNMPGIAYYAIWRRCHEAAIPVITREQVESAFREWTATANQRLRAESLEASGQVETVSINADRAWERLAALLFPEEAPADANPTGGAHA